MDALADAVVEAILYISTVSVSDDRADSDVTMLESLVYLLRQSSPEEKSALRGALERIRLSATDSRLKNPDFFDTLQTIEEEILGEDETDSP